MPNTSTIIALSAALDITLDDLVVVESLVDTIPALQLASLLVRESQLAALVLYRLDINLHLVADFQVGIVAELGSGDHTLALVADIDRDLALADLGNGTLYDLAHGDVRKRLVINIGNLLTALVVYTQIVLECVPIEILVGYVFHLFHNGK